MRLPQKRAFLRSSFFRVVQRASIFSIFVASQKKNEALAARIQAATDRYDSLRATPVPQTISTGSPLKSILDTRSSGQLRRGIEFRNIGRNRFPRDQSRVYRYKPQWQIPRDRCLFTRNTLSATLYSRKRILRNKRLADIK